MVVSTFITKPSQRRHCQSAHNGDLMEVAFFLGSRNVYLWVVKRIWQDMAENMINFMLKNSQKRQKNLPTMDN